MSGRKSLITYVSRKCIKINAIARVTTILCCQDRLETVIMIIVVMATDGVRRLNGLPGMDIPFFVD